MHYSDLISRSSASTSRIRRGSRHAISQEIEVESWKNKRVLRCPQPCPATTTVLPSARPLSDDPPPSLANEWKDAAQKRRLRISDQTMACPEGTEKFMPTFIDTSVG